MLCTCDVRVSNLAARAVSSTLSLSQTSFLSNPTASTDPQYTELWRSGVSSYTDGQHLQRAHHLRAERRKAVCGKFSLTAKRRPAAWAQPRLVDSWLLHQFNILPTSLFIAIPALITSGISLVLWPIICDVPVYTISDEASSQLQVNAPSI